MRPDQLLMHAVYQDDLPLFQQLLEKGADVHAADDAVLRRAVSFGFRPFVECLIAAGADVNAAGGEPIALAASTGDLPIVELLVLSGADIRANKDAAIRISANKGHAAVTEYLLKSYSDRQTALALALREASWNNQIELVGVLRLNGARLPAILPRFSDAVQVATVSTGPLPTKNILRYVDGLCPEATHVLLERTGHSELATMLRATQMLDPLAPEDRATLLRDLLRKSTAPETKYAKS